MLDSIAIFGGLSEQQMDRVLALMKKSLHLDGDQIFAKGDVASNIYVVVSGQVRLDFERSNHPLSEIIFVLSFFTPFLTSKIALN